MLQMVYETIPEIYEFTYQAYSADSQLQFGPFVDLLLVSTSIHHNPTFQFGRLSRNIARVGYEEDKFSSLIG